MDIVAVVMWKNGGEGYDVSSYSLLVTFLFSKNYETLEECGYIVSTLQQEQNIYTPISWVCTFPHLPVTQTSNTLNKLVTENCNESIWACYI